MEIRSRRPKVKSRRSKKKLRVEDDRTKETRRPTTNSPFEKWGQGGFSQFVISAKAGIQSKHLGNTLVT